MKLRDWVLLCVSYMREFNVDSATVPIEDLVFDDIGERETISIVSRVSLVLQDAPKVVGSYPRRWLASAMVINDAAHLVISHVAVSSLPSVHLTDDPRRFGNIFSGSADKYNLLSMPVGGKLTIERPNPNFDLMPVKNALIGSIYYYNKKLKDYKFCPLNIVIHHEKDKVGVSRITYWRLP